MRFSIIIIVFFLACSFLYSEGEDMVIKSTEKSDNEKTIKYEFETVIRSPMETLGKNAFWGGATGLLIGLAGHLALNPDHASAYYRIPISLGVFGGSAYAIYELMNREDLYIKTYNKNKIDSTQKEAFEKEKQRKIYATVRKRLDSPIKNAFYDSMWGGIWGLLMGSSIIWISDMDDSGAEESIMRIGTGGGILLGLGSSLLYNYIQRQKINELNSNAVKNSMFAYYDPNYSSWNLAFKIDF